MIQGPSRWPSFDEVLECFWLYNNAEEDVHKRQFHVSETEYGIVLKFQLSYVRVIVRHPLRCDVVKHSVKVLLNV